MRRLLLTLIAFFLLASPADAAWIWPVDGPVITPYRNGTDPYATGQHRGIDIAAPVGTPVVAAAGGEVRFAGTAGSSGLTIGIRTGDGYDTSYLHLSSLAVRAGTPVSAGDRIGAVGTTGVRSATAPHLHFGVRDAGTRHDYHDPLNLLPPPAAPPVTEPPPAPVTAPQPAPPPGAPVAAPSPRPQPHRGPVPTIAPRSRSVRNPLRRPATAPSSPRIAHPIPLHARHGAPSGSAPRTSPTAHRHLSAPDVVRAPTLSGDRGPSIESANPMRPAGAAADRAHSINHRVDDGPDLGWAAACAGLLLAAAVLGLTDDGRRAAKGTRSRLARVLPALGRR